MSVRGRRVGTALELSPPTSLFEFPIHSLEHFSISYSYDVAPGGRFLALTPVGSEASTLTVITNYLANAAPQ